MRRILSQRSWFRILDRLLTSVVHSSPLADCNYLIAVGWLPPEAAWLHLHYALWTPISELPPAPRIKPLQWNVILMPRPATSHSLHKSEIFFKYVQVQLDFCRALPHTETLAFKLWLEMEALGTSKAKVLRVFALQTSWAMWEENECHLLRLINKEHADVQLGRICFW